MLSSQVFRKKSQYFCHTRAHTDVHTHHMQNLIITCVDRIIISVSSRLLLLNSCSLSSLLKPSTNNYWTFVSTFVIFHDTSKMKLDHFHKFAQYKIKFVFEHFSYSLHWRVGMDIYGIESPIARFHCFWIYDIFWCWTMVV